MDPGIEKVKAIKEGLGKPLPREIIEKYEMKWPLDPLTANAQLFYFELRHNDMFLRGSTDEMANYVDFLSTIRFDWDYEWAIGIYGYPQPPEGGQIN